MEEILDTLEKATFKTLEEKYKNGKEKLDNEIEKLHRHIDELKLSSKKLTKSVGNKAQEFVAVKTSRKQIIEANEAEAKSVTNSSDVKVEFIADSTIKDALKEFKTFGLISVSNTENIREKMYVVKGKKQVNIKHGNDRKTCSIIGSYFTDDGLLFLADFNNKTLKLIDLSSESIKDKLNLEASPYRICQISKNDFAVSLNNQTIQFVTMDNKIITTKRLKLGHHCNGLAYKDNKLFISDSNTALYIYDMNDTMLQKITTDKQGNAIFKYNRGISVSSDGKMIYVADFDKGLIVLDLEGNYKTTITDPDFITLYGVCTDKRGNLFVCGWRQSKIVQINEKSAVKLGIIDNVCNGTSCSFCLKHNRLAVTISGSDTIEVYDLL
jgi:WD40 repeat protein